MNEVFFYLFAAFSVVFAIGAVTAKNVIRGGIFLLGSFVSLAAVYFSAGAEFVGIVQIIVYGGAIIVLYLFALMTIEPKNFKQEKLKAGSIAAGSVLSFTLLILIVLWGNSLKGEVKPVISGAKELAAPLFFKFLLPFEAISVLLLIATVGAVAIGRREDGS